MASAIGGRACHGLVECGAGLVLETGMTGSGACRPAALFAVRLRSSLHAHAQCIASACPCAVRCMPQRRRSRRRPLLPHTHCQTLRPRRASWWRLELRVPPLDSAVSGARGWGGGRGASGALPAVCIACHVHHLPEARKKAAPAATRPVALTFMFSIQTTNARTLAGSSRLKVAAFVYERADRRVLINGILDAEDAVGFDLCNGPFSVPIPGSLTLKPGPRHSEPWSDIAETRSGTLTSMLQRTICAKHTP